MPRGMIVPGKTTVPRMGRIGRTAGILGGPAMTSADAGAPLGALLREAEREERRRRVGFFLGLK